MDILILMSGFLLIVFSLLFIGAQVNKHQIRPNSAAAWMLRAGVLILLVNLCFFTRDSQIIQVSRILGVTLIAASIIIVNHEWVQAGDLNLGNYTFKPTPDMLFFFFTALLGNIGLLISLAQQSSQSDSFVLIVLAWMLVFSIRLVLSQERLRAGFRIRNSLSAQIFVCGALLLIIGTWLTVKVA